TAGVTACVWMAFAADPFKSKFRVTVQMVQLRVTATDAAGRYIRDLNERQFRVLENGIEQKIKVLSTPKQPEAARRGVFVLFDTSNRMYESFVYAEDAIADFVRRLDPSDAVAVYSFSRNLTRLAPVSNDRHQTMIGLRLAVLGDDTALY